jgi:hypothetical protein
MTPGTRRHIPLPHFPTFPRILGKPDKTGEKLHKHSGKKALRKNFHPVKTGRVKLGGDFR